MLPYEESWNYNPRKVLKSEDLTQQYLNNIFA